ncbi:ATP-binding cassette domain-containing protein [Streptomyces sp. DSM 41527]|uniref:ATP-binding cassette domain-containing protein n=1 Tax=Streptomyces mooreae TaxID=3075523 RepID=A0ABU2T3L4_9ACTN|nr:ATP-binding cassette domain-containing protein [Streptomyces sp. DSM 41527]MDT0454784.1 ATP-binding cassette domain-containing protein [Streptomyces sp. DSM 41527]
MTTTGRPAPTPQDSSPAMTDTSPPVTVTDLAIGFPDGPTLLRNTGLSLQSGRITALTGPSGSGKTTLLRALIGDLPHGAQVTSGSVEALGQDVFTLAPAALRTLRRHRIAYVGQDPGSALNPRMTAGQLIAEVATDPTPRAVAALMTECRLPEDLAHHRPGALSGGQQRRLALARALARHPDVLLLDEPTAGLDPALRDEIVGLLRRLAAHRGIAVTLACHDAHVVEACADTVITLRAPAAPHSGTGVPLRKTERPRLPEARAAAPVDGLRAAGLEVAFTHKGHTHQALTEADFHAPPGSATGIIGPSGSGKTTLLRALAGLQKPDAGTLTWNGQPLAAHARRRHRDQQRRIQLIPQNPLGALNPARTIGASLTRPLQLHRTVSRAEMPARVGELLDDVGLPGDFAARYPHELSGGQRQRASIARALATEPDLLLCDEVTSALDPATATAVMELLTRLRAERRLTLVLVSHELDLITAYTDSVHLLREGRVHLTGAGERVAGQLA